MLWLEYRYKEPIPEHLFYDGWQRDKNANQEPPLMLWIKWHHPREDIPNDYYYAGCQTDKNYVYKTPLMFWI